MKVALEDASTEKSTERRPQDFIKFLGNKQIIEMDSTDLQEDNGNEDNLHQEVFNDSQLARTNSQSNSMIDVKMSASVTSKRGGSSKSLPLILPSLLENLI